MTDSGSYEYSFYLKNLNDQGLLYIISSEPGHNLSQLLDSGTITGITCPQLHQLWEDNKLKTHNTPLQTFGLVCIENIHSEPLESYAVSDTGRNLDFKWDTHLQNNRKTFIILKCVHHTIKKTKWQICWYHGVSSSAWRKVLGPRPVLANLFLTYLLQINRIYNNRFIGKMSA